MSNIQTLIPERLSTSLNREEMAILTAYYYPRIKEQSHIEIIDPISQAITKAYLIMGSSPKDDYELILDEVVRELKANFSVFTVEEVGYAWDLGSKGKLGDDFVHVCVKGLLSWIWKYNEKFRRPAISKQNSFEDAERQKEKEEKLRIEFREGILKLYNGFPKSLRNIDRNGPAYIFGYLDKTMNLVQMDGPKRREIFGLVNQIYARFGNKPKNGIELSPENLAKFIALKAVFKEWKDYQFDLANKI